MNIGYLYYNFYPVTGGATIHGYHLARELAARGHTLYKLNGQADPYTQKLANPVTGFLRILKNCDVIYARMDYLIKPRNLLAVLSIIAGKKVIIELNSPSDELHLFGKSKRYIRRIDRWMARILKHADSVVVVSEPIREYCEKELGLANVTVVENGGERFRESELTPSADIRNQMAEVRRKWDQLIVWSGSLNDMQDFKLMEAVASSAADKNRGLVVIANEDPGDKLANMDPERLKTFINLSREDVKYIISRCDTGLAFYGDYSWSRWGFYNSSLKIFEFLNNGLLTITNKPGTKAQQACPNFRYARSVHEILTFMDEQKPAVPAEETIRTWGHVAGEISEIISRIART